MIATTATASSSDGSASSTSMMRITGVSAHFWKNAATASSTMPGISASTTDTKPIQNDIRAPNISRERMSRPASSVPRMNFQLPPSSHAGGIFTKSRYCSTGLCGEQRREQRDQDQHDHDDAGADGAPVAREVGPELAQRERTAAGRRDSVGRVFCRLLMGLPRVADARIQHAVQQVDDQAHDDHERRDQQDAALTTG